MLIQTAAEAQFKQEYGGEFRRLYPKKGLAETSWGSAWMVIQPGTTSTPHNHDEEETFIILSGEGEMFVDGETRIVGKGDVIYLPPFSQHCLRNVSKDKELDLLCIWWGGESA